MNNQSFIEILFFTTGILSIGYLLFMAITIARNKQQISPSATTDEGVSVVIAAHNEYENLQMFLPFI